MQGSITVLIDAFEIGLRGAQYSCGRLEIAASDGYLQWRAALDADLLQTNVVTIQ